MKRSGFLLLTCVITLARGLPTQAKTWAILDPATGLPIAADKKLALPDGQVMTAADYYAALNRHEKYLEAKGQTLATESSDLGFVKLEGSKRFLLSKQAAELEKSTLSPRISPDFFKAELSDEEAPVLAKANPCNSSDEFSYFKPWSTFLGSERFSIGPTAEFAVVANCKHSLAVGRAAVAAKVFFVAYDVVSVKVYAENKASKYRYGYKFMVAGYKVDGDEGETQEPKAYQGTVKESYAKGSSFTYTIGIVPVTLTYGIRGELGLVYQMGTRTLSAYGQIGPYGKLMVFLEGGIGVDVAQLGVGGELLLVDAKFHAKGETKIEPKAGQLQAHLLASAQYEIRALDGKLYAFVKLPVPSFSWPPWKIKKYSEDVADWDGIERSGTFIDYQESKVLLSGEPL